ncbi:MAG: DUF6787 family protein [Bacteroidota bacterium]
MNFFEKLKNRWGLKNLWQVIVVLLVFALTGFTVLFAKKPILSIINQESAEHNIWISLAYYVLILPIYQIVLLFYAFVLGQFSFFWEFEKKTFRRVKDLFSRKS